LSIVGTTVRAVIWQCIYWSKESRMHFDDYTCVCMYTSIVFNTMRIEYIRMNLHVLNVFEQTREWTTKLHSSNWAGCLNMIKWTSACLMQCKLSCRNMYHMWTCFDIISIAKQQCSVNIRWYYPAYTIGKEQFILYYTCYLVCKDIQCFKDCSCSTVIPRSNYLHCNTTWPRQLSCMTNTWQLSYYAPLFCI
jgi:hypothetical protein